MADFDAAIQAVLKDEGGASCVANDHGGLTKYGIASRSYPDLDLSAITQEDAIAIYHRDFWNPLWDQLDSQPLATKLLVMTVNMGAHWATALLQQAINYLGGTIYEDGVCGHKTLEAANALDADALLAEIKARGLLYYVKIILHDPTQQTFMLGWIRRQIA